MVSEKVNYCRLCLLPELPEGKGMSSTSFLFSTLHCQCQKAKSDQVTSAMSTAGSSTSSREVCKEVCLRCGKEIVPKGKRSGFISLLLRSFRCRCAKPLPGTGKARHASKALQGTLATQFVPRSGNKTRQARLERQAVNRTQMVLSGVRSIALQDLHTGEIIANSYVLEEQIGLGGMGAVYRARHQMLGRLCALKFLLPSAVTATSWDMFKNEAKILNELQHPAICRIFDMGLHKGCLPFYAMEFLDGITLEELLNRKNTLGLGAALEIFIAVGDALTYAHRQKIIHKDVKPANIMLVKAGKGVIAVKLLDFGIAELSESGVTTEISEVAGSAAYMSPEQFTGRSLTPASDVYSLACSLFETLAGDAPFDGQNFEELSQQHQELPAPTLKEVTGLDFPSDIEVVLEHALRKDPNRRYHYMSEITVDLQRILQGKPLQFARGETTKFSNAFDEEVDYCELEAEDEPDTHKTHQHSLKLVLATVAFFLVGILGIAVFYSSSSSSSGLGMALHQRLGLKVDEFVGKSSKPKYFRLTKSEFEKLDYNEPYNSKFEYYLFPPEGARQIGQICLYSPASGHTQKSSAAGLVKLPHAAALEHLGLLLSNGVIENLELLGGFQPDELVHVTFPRTDLRHTSTAMSEVNVFSGTSTQSYQLLCALHNFGNLKSIDFQCVTLDDESVRLLDGFPHLEEVQFADGRLQSESTFGKLSCLSRLKILSLPPLEDASEVFARLVATKHLEEMKLQNFACSDREVAAFQCPDSLRRLKCSQSSLSIPFLKKLAVCPNIKVLDFSSSILPPESAPLLMRMLWLEKLVLPSDILSNWGNLRLRKFVGNMKKQGCALEFCGESGSSVSSVTKLNLGRQNIDLVEEQIRHIMQTAPE